MRSDEKEFEEYALEMINYINEAKKQNHSEQKDQPSPILLKQPLAPNFDPKNQHKYATFWEKQLPVISKKMKKEHHLEGIAKRSYTLVANKRKEIAVTLNQKASDHYVYGNFREEQDDRFRDAVFKEDARFGWQYDAIKQKLESYLYGTFLCKEKFETNTQHIECLLSKAFINKCDEGATVIYKLPKEFIGQDGIIVLRARYNVIDLIFHKMDPIVQGAASPRCSLNDTWDTVLIDLIPKLLPATIGLR